MYARAQLAPLACMLHTMLRLRSNVLRLTKLSQRPVPEPTKGVGLWGTLLMFEVIRIYRRDIRRDRTSLPCARLGAISRLISRRVSRRVSSQAWLCVLINCLIIAVSTDQLDYMVNHSLHE